MARQCLGMLCEQNPRMHAYTIGAFKQSHVGWKLLQRCGSMKRHITLSPECRESPTKRAREREPSPPWIRDTGLPADMYTFDIGQWTVHPETFYDQEHQVECQLWEHSVGHPKLPCCCRIPLLSPMALLPFLLFSVHDYRMDGGGGGHQHWGGGVIEGSEP